MSQQVQELIDKIKSEGIGAAQEQAHKIIQDAQARAQQMISEAKLKSDQMIVQANQEIQRNKASSDVMLKRASRDMILTLRKQIEDILQRIIQENVTDSLKGEQLAEILERILEKSVGPDSVEIALSAKDLEYLKKGFIAKLQKKIKESVEFKSSDEIAAGFTISFDGGKSCFDFTDVSLADYLGQFLNAQVASLVKEAARS